MLITYKEYAIKVFNDPDYTFDSADNLRLYDKEYFDDKGISKHGIQIMQNDKVISSVLICETGGLTTIHEQSAIVKNDKIFICCGYSIFALNLPDLSFAWKKRLDLATCFGLYDFKTDLTVHGEIQVSRLTIDGNIKWEFSARDIFITLNGEKSIEFTEDYVLLKDWQGYMYKLDENGKVIID